HKERLFLRGGLSPTTLWPEFVPHAGRTGEPGPTGHPRFKLDFFARFQAHFHRGVKAQDSGSVLGDHLAIGVRHSGRVLVQGLSDVLELRRLFADVADPDNERDRLAEVVGSLLGGVDGQTRLQAADRRAPGGDALLLRLFLWHFHTLRGRRLVALAALLLLTRPGLLALPVRRRLTPEGPAGP